MIKNVCKYFLLAIVAAIFLPTFLVTTLIAFIVFTIRASITVGIENAADILDWITE